MSLSRAGDYTLLFSLCCVLCLRRFLRMSSLYSFPIGVVTHYHPPRGFKQYKFIILQFWRWWRGCILFWGLEGRINFPAFFPASWGRPCSLAHGWLPSIFKTAMACGVLFTSHHFDSASIIPFPSESDFPTALSHIRTLMIPVGVPRWPRILNWIPSTKSLLPCEVIYSQVPGIRRWTSLGGHYSAYQACNTYLINL